MISKIIGRQKELSLPEDEWTKINGRLIILYMQRRIGKTRLITEFTSGKNGIFYLAEDISLHIQITRLQEKIAEFTKDQVLRTFDIKDWDQFFFYCRYNNKCRRARGGVGVM